MGKIIHEVVVDVPRQHHEVYPNLHRLVILKQDLFYDYRTGPPSYERLYQDTIRWIQDYPYERLKGGVELNNGPQMLELCLRHCADCEVPATEQLHSKSHIAEMLEDLACVNGEPLIARAGGKRRHIKNSTLVLQKRALAACAWMNFNSHFALPQGGSLYAVVKDPLMHYAAFCAHHAAASDFVPPIVIRIASWLQTLQMRYPGVDIRTMSRFCKLKHLWRAWDAYCKRRTEQQIAGWFKTNSAPNLYSCGGCDVQAVHKNALRACGGNCPPEKKPHYCSRECQEKHWYVHRYVCKRGLAEDPIMEDDGDPAWIDLSE